jgi:cupin fold WbuC family metalloprotein
MKLIDLSRLNHVRQLALASPRRRANDNLHPQLDDPVQRFLNALEPGTYVRPHRHTTPPKWELFAILAGAAAVLEFDATGRVTRRVEIAPLGEVRGVEIAAGVWHSLVALAPGTVLLELKPGPYAPAGDKDFASWAPAEQAPDAAAFARRLQTVQAGDDAAAPAMAE